MTDIKKDLIEKIKNKINNNIADTQLKHLLSRLIDYESMNEEGTYNSYKDHYDNYIEEALEK